MADGTLPPKGGAGVGSVAEETARLLDALLGGEAGGAAESHPGNQQDRPAAEPEAPPACPTCGHVPGDPHTPGSAEAVCHLCPVCQLLRVVRSVSPQTLDRLADLAGAVTEALRDAAASRRPESAASPSRPRPSASPVERIVVTGDEPGPGAASEHGEAEEAR